jgi:hypothetical protein
MTTRKQSHRKGWLAIALAAVALIAGSLPTLIRRWPSVKLMRTAANSPWRPVTGRLSGFPYAPLPKNTQAKTRSAPKELPRLRSAAASVLSSPDRDPSTSASALLLYGDTSNAVIAFESLVTHEPENASHWSDLAAARLQEGNASNDARTIAHSLAAADHALALEPERPEALFNRALALDERTCGTVEGRDSIRSLTLDLRISVL